MSWHIQKTLFSKTSSFIQIFWKFLATIKKNSQAFFTLKYYCSCRTTYWQRCGTVTIFYGSGSDFWHVTVPVPDPYLVSRPQQFSIFFFFYMGTFFMLIEAALLPRNIISSFNMRMMLNEGNQIHNFILCLWELLWFHFITVPDPGSGSDFLARYGSASQKVTVPTVPVPQRCLPGCWQILNRKSISPSSVSEKNINK